MSCRAAPSARPSSTRGYPGYDTSVGWFHYSDDQVRENARRAVDAGFTRHEAQGRFAPTPRATSAAR